MIRARTPNAYGLIDADQTVPVAKSTIGLICWKNSKVSKARTSTMPDRRQERRGRPRGRAGVR